MTQQLRFCGILLLGVSISGCALERRERPVAVDQTALLEAQKQAAAAAAAAAAVRAERPKYLYVVSGTCYAGDSDTSAGSNTMSRYLLETGALELFLKDFNMSGFGDTPVGLVDGGVETLLVLLQNPSGRRIDGFAKATGGMTPFLFNPGLNDVGAHGFSRAGDGSLMATLARSIERFSSARQRLSPGGQASRSWVENPDGACAEPHLNFVDSLLSRSGKVIALHAERGFSALHVYGASGFESPGDCLGRWPAFAGSGTAMPTTIVQHPSGDLLVAYGGARQSDHFIAAYRFEEGTGQILSGGIAFANPAVVQGVSRMAVDPIIGEVLVANGSPGLSNIEKFSYNPSTQLLTRQGSAPYVAQSVFTRCVSGMALGN